MLCWNVMNLHSQCKGIRSSAGDLRCRSCLQLGLCCLHVFSTACLKVLCLFNLQRGGGAQQSCLALCLLARPESTICSALMLSQLSSFVYTCVPETWCTKEGAQLLNEFQGSTEMASLPDTLPHHVQDSADGDLSESCLRATPR